MRGDSRRTPLLPIFEAAELVGLSTRARANADAERTKSKVKANGGAVEREYRAALKASPRG